jgi:hypothetical protein
MSRGASLFSRRVPLRIWLPIVIACAAAGYVASTLWPVRPIASQPHIPRSEGPSQQAPVLASPMEEPTRTAGQLSRAIGPPREVAQHDRAPKKVRESAPPPPATKGTLPRRARAARAGHSVARASRPQRTAQQPVKASSTPSAGLKNIPLIGPVFSLFQ